MNTDNAQLVLTPGHEMISGTHLSRVAAAQLAQAGLLPPHPSGALPTGVFPSLIAGDALLRLPQVLAIIPVSRSSWYAGIQKNIYPKGVRISSRTTAWRVRDIAELLVRLDAEQQGLPRP